MVRRWTIAGTLTGGITGSVALVVYLLLSGTSANDIVPGLFLYLVSILVTGYAYSWGIRYGTRRLPFYESLPFGVITGGLAWIIFGLIISPVLAGRGVQWSVAEATDQFPLLMIYIILGLLTAGALHVLQLAGWLLVIDLSSDEMAEKAIQHRVVILGGGFAGVTAAQTLERLVGDGHDVEITIVSPDNHLLFTPMLAEVTAGGVEAQHITPPLRAFFRNTRVIQGRPIEFFKDQNALVVKSAKGIITNLDYDHLIFAIGSVPNYFGNTDLERYSFAFKSVQDASRIRSHIIDLLEQADAEPDETRRRQMLTFVVVGAGYAGSELIGGLNDFVRGALWYYKNLRNEEITMLLVHPADRILLELSEELALYAEARMTARGVTIQSGGRVTGAGPGRVEVGDETVYADTLIWTAGNVPNPALKMIGVELNKRGAVITDEYLRATNETNIWAIGDCAAIPDVITGGMAPPTAQYALREGKTVAQNVYAVIQGKAPKVFSHHSQGQLAVVGHQTAVAEVFGFKFSGLFAWLMWRGIYLVKLPTLEKKVRVLLDWIIDVFFPRDIAYAPLAEEMVEEKQAVGD